MRPIICCLMATALLCGCRVTPYQAFDRMSDEELRVYNAEVPRGEKVYCFEQVSLGSHMKKRVCATYNELVNASANSVDRIGVLDADSAIEPGRFIPPQ